MATLTMPDLEQELKKWTQEFKKPQGSWQVVLYNDPRSQFDDVVLWLQKSTGCSHQKASEVTKTAHKSGRAVCFGGEKDKCHQVATYLRAKGLQVEVGTAPR